MDRFIARENIKHFVDRLQTETDDCTRATVQRLLIAEEDKFAKCPNGWIWRTRTSSGSPILQCCSRAKVNDMRPDGDGAALAHRHLENLEQLYELFVESRQLVVTMMERSSL
ncbi:MAG: hypothetical protein E5W28_11170 [Mesorhizobium sp.]|uniref:hypothetical protein n=1 Tax=Mesorhizobium sp. TaxID=1871066 RepID=UPI000FE913BF|nr:hypothetical protein [Mesorhizobium sp.]RWE80151.1 MAG: hypothetical protein EOS63_14115 [Mesorhizobium sp.]TIT12382.1 MAG: hypothetical protein E5W74_09865 [Mesorhizobium sp.]TIU33485.1 MAG: hypothetical protein E5W28_11170 [Mesorhizobium sp.]TIV10036.1 MAG: hypothetical protein E5V94_06010 [Mesorhizobium sp.]TJW60765.1 MAG: hypothetical protein E5V97_23045 [Mesorhizobium sp.]